VAHPAGVEQDRFHALHLRDLLVERPRRLVLRRELGRVPVEPREEPGAEVGDAKIGDGPRLVHHAPPSSENPTFSW